MQNFTNTTFVLPLRFAYMRKSNVGFLSLFLVAVLSLFNTQNLFAQFTNGNLVVLQAGDGSAALGATATPMILKEFTPSGSAGISVAIPVSGTNALTISGSATSEGLLTRSSNGQKLIISGYNATSGTAGIAATPTTTTPRAIGVVDASGAYTLATTTTFYNASNIRGAASDGSNYWSTGAISGVVLQTSGAGTLVSNTVTNNRAIAVFNSQLYFSTASGSTRGIYAVGSGLPTTTGTTSISMISFGATSSCYQFSFNAAGNVCYIADDAAGIRKMTFDGTSWTQAYILNATACRGLVVDYSGADPNTGVGAVVYVTTTTAAANKIIKVTDAGSAGATFTDVATAPANTAFRGLAFAPVASGCTPTASTTNTTICSNQLPYSWNSQSITGAGTYTATLVNAGGCDSVATLVLTVNLTSSTLQNETACDTYTWATNGTTYTNSGTYTATSLNANGCTHTDSLVLTINNSTSNSTNVTACDTYTWAADGLTYTVSGAYTKTNMNVAGCVNTETLNLTINASTSSSTSATACDTYTWAANGLTYTSSGIYTKTTMNAAGCTHTETLNLTINASTSSSTSVTACDSYTWAANGLTYTVSGAYTKTNMNANGCVNTETLNLTINSSTSNSTTASGCGSYTWTVNNVTYTASGTYTSTSLNAAGCTHTETLNLTINQNTTATVGQIVCDTYTWPLNGVTYTNSGSYTATSLNAAGCTLTTTLNLTVNHSTTAVTSVTVCDTYTWAVNNATYTTSGTYTVTSLNPFGCTHSTVLNLTVNYATSHATPVTACNSYTWANNVTYTASGSYTMTSLNASGCTHTEILNLTINQNTTSSSSFTACDSYVWHAITYTVSGTYTGTQLNAAGCTETQTLLLTINNSTTHANNITACYTYTWPYNNTTYTNSGTYSVTSTNAAGCTHTEVLNLSIKVNTSSTSNIFTANSYTWAANNQTYTTSGTYTATLINAGGCDSTLTLNLTLTQINIVMTVQNAVQTAPNKFEYDVMLTYTGTPSIALRGYACGINHLAGMNNGGTITQAFVSRDAALATIPAVSAGYTASTNHMRFTTLNAVAGNEVLLASGTTVRLATMRITSTVNFPADFNPSFALQTLSAPGKTACIATCIVTPPGTTFSLNGVGNTPLTATLQVLNGVINTPCFYLNPTAPLVANSTANAVTCFGQSTGSIQVSLSGNGSTPTTGTYSVNGGSPVAYTTNPFTVNGLSAGIYTINVTSSTGCSASTVKTITQPASGITGSSSFTACDTYTWGGTTYTISGVYVHTFTSAAGCDSVHTLTLTINNSTSSSIPVTACDSYTWTANGVTYTASGAYTATSLNAAGCTHTTTLNLTINQSTSSSVSATACDTYTWVANGVTYTTSGAYTATSLNAAGCTHTTTLNLTVNQSTSSSVSATACDSYTWTLNNATYTSSGAYTSTSLNAAGCTHTTTLNLTINQSSASSVSATACDTYTWALNNATYTTSGSYTFTSLNAAGCTHTTTLNLTINQSTTSSNSVTACDTYTWAANGTTYTNSGTYTATSLNAAGCTHTSTLILTINNSTTSSVNVTACDSYTWAVNNATYTTSGSYTGTLLNAAGCTETVTLNLTINNSTSSSTSATDCDSYTWSLNNVTYTTSGNYTATSLNAASCTHTTTLNLTINNSTSNTTAASACDSYTWTVNGTTYTASGTYTSTSINAAGCTHSEILNLTINHGAATSSAATACDTYTWNGSTYTTSGSYTVTLINTVGCVDTATLNLTINNSSSNSTSISSCNTYTWSMNGVTYTNSGSYTATSLNAAGCTHTETLNLTVLHSTSSTTTISAVNSYTWIANGQTYTVSGSHTYTTLNAAGCDSTSTLNLSISTLAVTMTLQNAVQTAPNKFEYDVMVTYTGTSTLALRGYACGINFAAGMSGGGTLTHAFVSRATSLATIPAITPGYTAATNHLRLTTLNAIAGNEVLIAPGTTVRLATMRVTNTVNFPTDFNPALALQTLSAPGKTACILSAIVTPPGGTFSLNGIGNPTLANTLQVLTGAVSTPCFYLNPSASFAVSQTSTPVACYGQTSGSIQISMTGAGSVGGGTYSLNGGSPVAYAGNPFTISGLAGGSYTVNVTSAAGCTGSATATITQPSSPIAVSSSLTACDSYTWGGNTYTISGVYVHTFTSASGCDSIHTLTLTINQSSSVSNTITACDTYTWNSTTYTTSGVYVATFTNAAGCDSVYTLNLTVNYSTTSSASATACDSYIWNGTTYTTSGTYTVTSMNTAGCLNTDVLNLTINSSTSTSSTIVACQTYTWNVTGNTYTISGTYTQTSTNAAGCTHTDVLNLTVNTPATYTSTINALGCYVWSVNNTSYTTSGTYTYTVLNGGCVDTYILTLNVTPGIKLAAKAILSGPYDAVTGLMRDSLRQLGLLPTGEPYTGSPYNKPVIGGPAGETVSPAILAVTGSNAIVDWIFVELRSASNPSTIVATKRALLQRDGDIVSNIDGTSPVFFAGMSVGNYYVSVKHRNHLGVMTPTAMTLDNCNTPICDFISSPVYFAPGMLNPARKPLGALNVLWSADANNNKNLKYNGLSNDKDFILGAVGVGTPTNSVNSVYRMEDVNLDGKIRYNGNDNDRNIILNNVGVNSQNNVIYQHTPN